MMMDPWLRPPQATGNCSFISLKISVYFYVLEINIEMESSCMPCFFGFPIMYVSFICVVVCGCDLFIFIILQSIHSTR